VSSTWSRLPEEDRPQTCKHWQCAARRTAAAALYVISAAAFFLFAAGIALAAFQGGWLFAGILAFNFAFVLWIWPHPAADTTEALIEATRECRCCSPQDIGPCTCKQDCGSSRCTAWIHHPEGTRSAYQDFTTWETEL
jgi:hypothetical protein